MLRLAGRRALAARPKMQALVPRAAVGQLQVRLHGDDHVDPNAKSVNVVFVKRDGSEQVRFGWLWAPTGGWCWAVL